jgi:hypothetical protein
VLSGGQSANARIEGRTEGGLSRFVRSDTIPEADETPAPARKRERREPRRERADEPSCLANGALEAGPHSVPGEYCRRRGWRHRCPLAIWLCSRFSAPVLAVSRYRLIGDGRPPMLGGRPSSVVADLRALTDSLAANCLRTGIECRYLEPNSVALLPQTRPASASPQVSSTVSDTDASGSHGSRRQYTAGS